MRVLSGNQQVNTTKTACAGVAIILKCGYEGAPPILIPAQSACTTPAIGQGCRT